MGWKMKRFYSDLIKLIIFIFISTLLASIFRLLNFHESNYILAYVLVLVILSRYTKGYFFSILSSVFSVLAFNFFFTEPYYSLRTYREDYPLTFFVMLIVASITTLQTTKLKKEMQKSIEKEKSINLLYEINKELLKINSKKELAKFSSKTIAKILKKNSFILLLDINGNTEYRESVIWDSEEKKDIFFDSIQKQNQEKAIREKRKLNFIFDNSEEKEIIYIPMLKNDKCLGLLGIKKGRYFSFSKDEKSTLEAVIILLISAIDRENLYEIQKNSSLEVEKERLRSNLLRSISHDLRTPLTSIIGSVSTILDKEKIHLSEKIKEELLQNILEDATWLVNSSENILSMTKIQEGKFILNKNLELVSELLFEVIMRGKKIAKNHKLELVQKCEDIFINVDALLIIQLLYNLIENAIKYTRENSVIKLIAYSDLENVYFELMDNGDGIPQEDLDKIFDRFYRSSENANAEKRGLGLGLTICKSIAIAHDGHLTAYNNTNGGATFKLSLKKEEI